MINEMRPKKRSDLFHVIYPCKVCFSTNSSEQALGTMYRYVVVSIHLVNAKHSLHKHLIGNCRIFLVLFHVFSSSPHTRKERKHQHQPSNEKHNG